MRLLETALELFVGECDDPADTDAYVWREEARTALQTARGEIGAGSRRRGMSEMQEYLKRMTEEGQIAVHECAEQLRITIEGFRGSGMVALAIVADEIAHEVWKE